MNLRSVAFADAASRASEAEAGRTLLRGLRLVPEFRRGLATTLLLGTGCHRGSRGRSDRGAAHGR